MSHETSPKRKVFFCDPANTDAIVFDPPDETSSLYDVIDATMTSKSDKAQVATVHNRLAFTERQLYWLMLRAREHFAELPEADRHDLEAEFGGRVVLVKLPLHDLAKFFEELGSPVKYEAGDYVELAKEDEPEGVVIVRNKDGHAKMLLSREDYEAFKAYKGERS